MADEGAAFADLTPITHSRFHLFFSISNNAHRTRSRCGKGHLVEPTDHHTLASLSQNARQHTHTHQMCDRRDIVTRLWKRTMYTDYSLAPEQISSPHLPNEALLLSSLSHPVIHPLDSLINKRKNKGSPFWFWIPLLASLCGPRSIQTRGSFGFQHSPINFSSKSPQRPVLVYRPRSNHPR